MKLLNRFIKWTTYCEFVRGRWIRKSKVGKFFRWVIRKEEL